MAASFEPTATLATVEALTGLDLGAAARSELDRGLSVLVAHLLKWEFDPDGQTDACRALIQSLRVRITTMIIARPSLALHPGRALRHRYRSARTIAMAASGLRTSAFPDDCPYSAVQALDSDYLPEAA
jgi:hypothetical protein